MSELTTKEKITLLRVSLNKSIEQTVGATLEEKGYINLNKRKNTLTPKGEEYFKNSVQ